MSRVRVSSCLSQVFTLPAEMWLYSGMREFINSTETLTLVGDGKIIVRHVEVARTLAERMKGLLGRDTLPGNHGLLLSPCGSIHTLFMRFSLDLIFLDKGLKVVQFCRDVKPNGMAGGGPLAHSVIEVQSGWLDAGAVHEDDQLSLEPSGS